jgi:hypothetical protein
MWAPSSGSSGAANGEVVFSEYVEGSSNNKAIEISNRGNSAVDLARFEISIHANGSDVPTGSRVLSGTLDAGASLVLCHPSASPPLLARCDVTHGTVANFNGDDALVLADAQNHAVLDSFGDVNPPGPAWDTGGVGSQNRTLRRKCSVRTGSALPAAFNPSLQWDGADMDDFSNVREDHCRGGSSSSSLASSTSSPGASSSSSFAGSSSASVGGTGLVQGPAVPPGNGDHCVPGGFCWARLAPQGNAILAIDGTAPSDVWAVGAVGTILRWDGLTWRRVHSGTTADVNSVSALTTQDAWATAGQRLLHWEGAGWREVEINAVTGTGAAHRVWAAGPNDVWVAGGIDGVYHWNGSGWTRHPLSGALWNELGGTSSTDVWFSNHLGQVAHWDGVEWRVRAYVASQSDQVSRLVGFVRADIWGIQDGVVVRNTTMPNLFFNSSTTAGAAASVLTGTSNSNLVAANNNVSSRWNGSSWMELTPSLPHSSFQAFSAAGSGGTDLWLGTTHGALQRVDGNTLVGMVEPRTERFHAVTGNSNELWAVGERGLLAHSTEPGVWTNRSAGVHGVLVTAFSAGPGHLVAAGDVTHTVHWNGSTFDVISNNDTVDVSGVWATLPGEVWAAGGAVLRHKEGERFVNRPSELTGGHQLPYADVDGVSSSAVWVVGAGGRIYRWDGSTWSRETSGTNELLTAVWARTATDVWAVGANTVVRNFTGASWTNGGAGLPTGRLLRAVHGTSSTDVWAVGDGGLVAHRTSGGWSTTTVSTGTWRGVFALSDEDAWLVGDGGQVRRWNGGAWVGVPSGTTARLNGVYATDATHAWAVGEDGTLVSLVGGAFQGVPTGITTALTSVSGSGPNDVWVAGARGEILHVVGTSVERWSSGMDVGTSSVHGVSATDIWRVGGTQANRWNGNRWTRVNLPAGIPHVNAVHQVSAGLAWAVGNTGLVLRWGGTTWEVFPGPVTSDLKDVWASGPSDAWAAGDQDVLRFDGQAWNVVPGTANLGVCGISGTGPADVWLVSWRAELFHWDGQALARVQTPTRAQLTDVFARGADVTAVGWNGVALRLPR